MASEKTSDLKGPLPDDFPGRQALADADINTYAQLRKAGDLTAIAGIGPATAEKIEAALSGTGDTTTEAAPEMTEADAAVQERSQSTPEELAKSPGMKADGVIVLPDGRTHDPRTHIKALRVDTNGRALSAADDEFVEAELAKAK